MVGGHREGLKYSTLKTTQDILFILMSPFWDQHTPLAVEISFSPVDTYTDSSFYKNVSREERKIIWSVRRYVYVANDKCRKKMNRKISLPQKIYKWRISDNER